MVSFAQHWVIHYLHVDDTQEGRVAQQTPVKARSALVLRHTHVSDGSPVYRPTHSGLQATRVYKALCKVDMVRIWSAHLQTGSTLLSINFHFNAWSVGTRGPLAKTVIALSDLTITGSPAGYVAKTLDEFVNNTSITSKVWAQRWCKRRGSDRGDAPGAHHSATLNEIGPLQFGVLQCAHVLLKSTTNYDSSPLMYLPAPPSVPQRNA